MRASRALFLFAFFSLSMLVGAARIGIRQENEAGGNQTKAASQQSAIISVSARDGGSKQSNPAASTHFEPLVLFLFGSMLFSLGTAINFVLSRNLKRKSAQTTTGHLSPVKETNYARR
jgi:hypothetical protein